MSNTVNTVNTENKRMKRLVLTGLLAALTFVGTMIIKIPTSTGGYIHPGDGFVLLSGLLLGPVLGPFAAGFGSALSDLISGYLIYAPATFIVKALSALTAYLIHRTLIRLMPKSHSIIKLIITGIFGELVMVIGYFLFEIFMLSVLNNISIYAGLVAAVGGIIPNLIQGAFGIAIATLLYPLLIRLSQD